MQTNGKPLPLELGEKYVAGVHQQEFQLPEEPNLSFRVVNASGGYGLGHFWYEIWNKNVFGGEYAMGGSLIVTSPETALEVIKRSYKECLKPV